MEGEQKRFRQKKMRLLILWKTSKAKSHFCSLLLTFPVIFFFSFLERAREISHRKYSDHEKHQELGKLSEGMRKARILGKRKAFVICQKFFYLLWWSIPHGQAFHIKLGSPLSTFSLAPLLLLPMERQNTWVTCSKGTCTRSGGLQPVMTPQLLLGELCPLQLWRGKSSG